MTALATESPLTATLRPGRARRLGPRGLIAVVLAGQAMASLDTAIVNVAAPDMQRDLHLTGPALQLVVYAYLLSYAGGLITAARLGARRGFGGVFTAGVALFTASSLACGLAGSETMLVAARAVQGVGAALLVAQVLSLLQTALEGERRRRALALYGMVLAAGVAAGQVVGGVLVSADLFGTGWRPIFLVNVPVGLGVLAFATGRLPAGSRTERGRLDLGGAGLLAVAMLALLVPLSFGADSGWPAWCWPTLAAGAGLVAWFARHVRRLASQGRAPLIEPSLFGRNGVRVPLGGAFVLMSCYGGVLFTTALYLQSTLHDSALRAGLTFAAYAAGFATASLTWARLPATLHAHVPGAGFALITAATAALALASRGPWHWYATALLAAAGAGHGAGFGALVRRAAARVNRQHAASLSGLLATVNQLAIAIGVATAGTLYVTFIRIGHGAHALSPVLLVVAAVEALSGATVAVLLARRSAISGGRQYRA